LFKSDDAGRHWQETGSGLSFNATYGGPISRSVVVPQNHYLFEAGVRLMRSEDNGDSWTPTGLRLVGGDNVTAVLAIPGGVIYSSYTGTFRSTDSGATFAPVQGLPPAGQLIGVLRMNPDSLHLLAGVTIRGVGTAAVYRSTDLGMTWVPLPSLAANGSVVDIAMVDALITVVSFGDRLFVSTDQGATWKQRLEMESARVAQTAFRGAGLVAMNGQQCHRSNDYFVTTQSCGGGLPLSLYDGQGLTDVVAVSDGNSHRVLTSARGIGVIALDGAATTWAPSITQLQAEPRRGLALSSTDPNWIWSGRLRSDRSAPALFRSNDGGQSWQATLTGRANFIRTLALDPTTDTTPTARTLYAAGETVRLSFLPWGSGIFKSVDDGANWLSLDEGIPPVNGSPQSGVRLSAVHKLLLDPRSCASPPAQGPCTAGPLQTVYALSNGSGTDRRFRVIKSTQGGANWMPVGTSLPDDIYAGTAFQGIHPADLEIDSNGTLYLSVFVDYLDENGSTPTPTITSGVFRSDDGGQTWTPRNAGLPSVGDSTTTRDVLALVIHPRRPGVLYASTIAAGQSSQIHLSDDGGENWKGIGTELTDCNVRDLQIDSAAPQVLYAAGIALNGSKGCVWRSEDGGFNWTSLSTGLPVHAVYDVRQQPQDRRRLILATSSGLWHGLVPSDRIFNDTEN
jgi:photosystem II stability/assembly factor-like uncharacterized protein